MVGNLIKRKKSCGAGTAPEWEESHLVEMASVKHLRKTREVGWDVHVVDGLANAPTVNAKDVQPKRRVHQLDLGKVAVSGSDVLPRLAFPDAQGQFKLALDRTAVDHIYLTAETVVVQPTLNDRGALCLVNLLEDLCNLLSVEPRPLGHAFGPDGVFHDVDHTLAASGRNAHTVVYLVYTWVPGHDPLAEALLGLEGELLLSDLVRVRREQRTDTTDPREPVGVEVFTAVADDENLLARGAVVPIIVLTGCAQTVVVGVESLRGEFLSNPVSHVSSSEKIRRYLPDGGSHILKYPNYHLASTSMR
ncbi:MAG: hypothetical protein COV59_01930 [Candidatus Magasanikbacteria bacterium CG11_big_fil_rev_8_21_14_0_20_39_34]|uniref:Uncharacterized protein n=1 Tax=Candidatus Magasanikbacteria bacterium CG11_big_fil_rev_8_21_14_0_20_39_34 TaxID=1974653 RepID=A0A2H0N729_9BACT|nr:MAG: hypothetical protein COV59_01930 [Candidatus Magasanikbacteria bacterium CG11_big_fil_rev_8_21_14_0_20_39_34]